MKTWAQLVAKAYRWSDNFIINEKPDYKVLSEKKPAKHLSIKIDDDLRHDLKASANKKRQSLSKFIYTFIFSCFIFAPVFLVPTNIFSKITVCEIIIYSMLAFFSLVILTIIYYYKFASHNYVIKRHLKGKKFKRQ